MIIGVIIDLVIGIGCIVMGLLVWKKQMILLVNNYQRKNVKKDDMPAYTRMIGITWLTWNWNFIQGN